MKFRHWSILLCLILSAHFAVAQKDVDSIRVIPVSCAAPGDSKKLGSIRIGNNAVKTHCDYEALVTLAKKKAHAMGGNVVKITQLESPVFIGKCYRVEADVYYSDSLFRYGFSKGNNKIAGPANNNYATLYIYRLKDTLAFVTPYHVHMENDSVICTVRSRSRDSVRVYREGGLILWAKTEKRADIKLDIKFGQSYFVRCGLQKGEIRMVPVIQLMENNTGSAEYGKLRKRKPDMDVSYLNKVH